MLSYKNFARKFLYDNCLTTLFFILGAGGEAPQNDKKGVVKELLYKNFLAAFSKVFI